jgi:hypothetical protein
MMMHKKFAWLLAFFLLLPCSTIGSSAQEQKATDATALYEAVLTVLFPPVEHYLVPENSRNIILRFTSSMLINRDLQILIYGQGSQQERYEVWRLPKGSHPISWQVLELRERLKTNDAKVIASSIQIEHFVIGHPTDRLKETVAQIGALCFSPVQDEGFVIDGIRHSLWIESMSNSSSIVLEGGESSAHPLIKWMWAVRSATEGQLGN